jgi:hypothetical protein
VTQSISTSHFISPFESIYGKFNPKDFSSLTNEISLKSANIQEYLIPVNQIVQERILIIFFLFFAGDQTQSLKHVLYH